ncbi:mediator of RNA polymerase II transcription subunit 12-like [Diabrotica virgifera virgifera]|uniref:Alpha-tubulin N-acetyltransferase n=1 Tax=Diabrotica virgifera virgifera TaxID=50390 RepID=A0A6P7F4N4_DIAVI|nr:mediator of RNA polymerase II transcription subunit 12-like [Diabrotica virgifera virgifera]XP_028128424.1 mediator of RNA polymerase II transcription subunit 12-like [Diabrotica virgifera virgifera]XP_028128425.1 mediator of RNA polymerase II transcription subunit 12-like [Diabrotica virgifera virgifera]XP_028128426.1 mediator of RNA polymerase II transcription subunit 12-like [Diabrotica virgifera virgifera]
MEFNYNINEIFKSPIVEINHSLIPPGYTGDRRALRDVVTKVSDIVNAMGEASAAAQGLTKPVTTADRLRNSEHKLYFLIDSHANGGRGAVTGMLKTGNKSLYVFDREGTHYQVAPPCLLDFYIHESRQRTGLGKQLFEYMLHRETVEPVQMAIDRPSEKLLGFFKKHYHLSEPVKQMNNYVVYDGFFPSKEHITPPEAEVEDARSVTSLKKNSANGLQAFQVAPLGRYGAPRPPCSMGQIIHNQSTVDQRKEPAGVQSLPATNYAGTSYSPQPNSYKTQSTPNMYYGHQYQNNPNQYQSNMAPTPNQAQVDSANLQNLNYQNQNYSYPTSNTFNTTPVNVNEYQNQMNYGSYAHQQSGNGKWAMGDSQNIQTDQQYQQTAPTISPSRVADGMIDHGQIVNKEPLIASTQDQRVPQTLNQQQYNPPQPPQMTQSAVYQPVHSTYSVQGLRQPQMSQTVPNLSVQQRYPTDTQQSQTYVNQPNQQNIMANPQETIQTPVVSMQQWNQPQSSVAVPQQYTAQQVQQEIKYNPSVVPPPNSFENQRQFTPHQSHQVAAPTQQYHPVTPHVQRQNGMGDPNHQNQPYQRQGHPQQQYYTQQVATSGDSRQQYVQRDQNQVTHSNMKQSENTNRVASTLQMSPNVKPELSKTQIVPDTPQANYVPGIGEARTEQQFQTPLNAAGQTNLQYSQNHPNWEQNRTGSAPQSAPYNQIEQRNEQSKVNQLPQGYQFNIGHQKVENQPQSVQQYQNNEQSYQNQETMYTSRGLNLKDAFGKNLNQSNNQNPGNVQPNYQMMNASNTNTFNTQSHSLPAPKHTETQQNIGQIQPTSSYQYDQYYPPQQISSSPNTTQDQNITSTGVMQQPHQTINLQSTAYHPQQLGQLQAQGNPASSVTATTSTAVQQTSIPANQMQQNYQNQPTTAESNQTQPNISTYQDNFRIRPSQHQLNSQQRSIYTQQNIGQYLHSNGPSQPQVPRLMQQQAPVLNTIQEDVPATTAGQVGYQLKQHEQIQPNKAGDYLAQPLSNPSFQGNTAEQVGYQLKQYEQIQPKQAGDYLTQPQSNPSFQGNTSSQIEYQLKQHEPVQPKQVGDYLTQPHSNPSFQGNNAGQAGYQVKQHEQIQPNQAGDYLAYAPTNPSIQGDINQQTKPTKSAAELFKTNAFEPTSISKLAKRHLNKITQPTECDLVYGYPPQRNESSIFNAPIPSIRQRS